MLSIYIVNSSFNSKMVSEGMITTFFYPEFSHTETDRQTELFLILLVFVKMNFKVF